MKYSKPIIATLIILSSLYSLPAQESRFGAAAVAGLNLTQIDGDFSAGFYNLGLTAGVRGIVFLGETSELGVEFLFSQRGSQSGLLSPDSDLFNISLNFIELPITLSIKDWLIEEQDGSSYHKVAGHAGVSLARLISADVTDPENFNTHLTIDGFNDTDVSWILGGSIYFTRNVGFTVRYTRSLTKVHSAPNPTDGSPIRSYFVTFRGEYKF